MNVCGLGASAEMHRGSSGGGRPRWNVPRERIVEGINMLSIPFSYHSEASSEVSYGDLVPSIVSCLHDSTRIGGVDSEENCRSPCTFASVIENQFEGFKYDVRCNKTTIE